MKFYLSILLALSSFSLLAQTISVITTADGLINNSVNCLALDEEENIWFGTQEGISFYDGIDFTNYDQSNVPSLLSNMITAIAVDKQNDLWVGTDFGLHKFDGTVWSNFTTDNSGLGDNRIKYLLAQDDETMLIAHSDGLSVLNTTNGWTDYGMSDGIPFGGTNYIALDEDGQIWLSSPLAGVLLFDGNTFTPFTVDDGLITDNVRSIAIDKEENKWIGTSEGITVLDKDNEFVETHEDIFELPAPHTLSPIEDIEISCDGVVWVAVYADYLVTEGGISFYKEAQWGDFNPGDGLSGPVVRKLVSDSKNTVWIATSTGITKIENDLCLSANEEIDVTEEFYVFPNPADDFINLSATKIYESLQYEIINALGAIVSKGQLRNSNDQITTQNLTAGYYQLRLRDLNHSLPFIKQ